MNKELITKTLFIRQDPLAARVPGSPKMVLKMNSRTVCLMLANIFKITHSTELLTSENIHEIAQ